MDEKTEELRDIFLDVADEEMVTESQEESHGSLTDDDQSVDERLREVVEEMRDQFEFTTDLADDQLRQIIRLFYQEHADETIAEELSIHVETIFQARMDLHLVRESEPEIFVDGDSADATLDAIRDHESGDTEQVAAAVEPAEETVDHIQQVIATRDRARRVSHRFTTAFEEILTDADLTVQFAADAHEDGLKEATDGAETNVEF